MDPSLWPVLKTSTALTPRGKDDKAAAFVGAAQAVRMFFILIFSSLLYTVLLFRELLNLLSLRRE